MTEPTARDADRYLLAKARRRRARHLMRAVIVCCLLIAAGIGAQQLYAGGLQLFLQRPPGVGATPPSPTSAG